MDQFENNLWSAPAKADKLRLFVLGQLQLRPRRQLPLNCHSEWTQWIAGTGKTMELTQIGQTHPFR